MRSILVDDEVELVSTLAERLEMRGIDAVYATSAEEALALLKDQPFDVAVLDVKLPRVDGLTLKKRMQAVAPELQFIFVTGHGSSRDFETGSQEVGADYYLIKPLKLEVLIAKMEEAMNRKRGGTHDAR